MYIDIYVLGGFSVNQIKSIKMTLKTVLNKVTPNGGR